MQRRLFILGFIHDHEAYVESLVAKFLTKGGQNNDSKCNDLAILGTGTPSLVKFDIVDLHSNTDFAVIS